MVIASSLGMGGTRLATSSNSGDGQMEEDEGNCTVQNDWDDCGQGVVQEVESISRSGCKRSLKFCKEPPLMNSSLDGWWLFCS